jgi:hypothetical protein
VQIGFGTVLAAGSVYRKDYGDGLLVYGEALEPRAVAFDHEKVRAVDRKVRRSLRYIGHLVALESWFRHVRLAAIAGDATFERALVQAALGCIDAGVRARIEQVDQLLASRRPTGATAPADVDEGAWRRAKEALFERASLSVAAAIPAGVGFRARAVPHLEWVSSLDQDTVHAVQDWLGGIVQRTEALYRPATGPGGG